MVKKEMYCNLCGSKFDFWDEQSGYSIHKVCGYGSENDGMELRLDICCSCMDEMIKKCAINPIEIDFDDGSVEEVFNECGDSETSN